MKKYYEEKLWKITFTFTDAIDKEREYWTTLHEATKESAVAQFMEWNKNAKVITVEEM